MYPTVMQIDGIKEEPLVHPKGRSWVYLITTGYEQSNVKLVEINPLRTMKISPSLSID